ncbi:MAG: hypothetical protein HYU41_10230 [Candidatus Rokubacteria bacterium]|nr:hypothetical protein [Candidatus Rokubacteria bacterium]
MTRVGLATLAVVLVLGVAGVWLARALGLSGSRAAAIVSIASQWIAAWAVWTFAGAIAVHAGVLPGYEPTLFAAIALGGGLAQYHFLVRGAADRARAVFVGAQLAWLLVVMVQNGVV